MTEHTSTACPECKEGEIELEVSADHVFAEARIVNIACGCLLDPSQREAIEREAIEDVTEGSQV